MPKISDLPSLAQASITSSTNVGPFVQGGATWKATIQAIVNAAMASWAPQGGTSVATGNATYSGTLGVTGATTLAALSATTGAFSSTVTLSHASVSLNRPNTTGQLAITGGTLIGSDGASIQLFGSTSSDVNFAVHNAATHLFRSMNGGSTFATLSSSSFAITPAVTMASTLAVTTSVTAGTGNAGLVMRGYTGSSSYGALYRVGDTPSDTNSVLASNGSTSILSGTTSASLAVGMTNVLTATSTAAVFSGTVKTGTYTVATLPAAGTVGDGARAFVSDATAPVWGSAVVGGGATGTPTFVSGAAWIVG